VHRDFSPQNILVGVDGISRLTDFGIAKAAGGQATATGVLKGKLAYMSPEQARGRRVDRRTDVWAAGVLAWELLARRRLYPSRNEADVLLAVVSKPPPPLDSVAPNVSKELSDAVAWALSFERSTRCPDAMTLRERLAPAWKAAHGLADRETLAKFVSEAVGEELQSRRQRVAAVLEQRSASSKIGAFASSNSGETADSLVLAPSDSPDTTAFHAVTTKQKRRRLAYRAGGLTLAALVVGSGVFATIALRESPSGGVDSVANAPIATSAPVPEAPKLAPEPVPPSGTLIVESNESLTRVRIGRRNIELGAPTKRAEVALLPDEFGKALSLECSSESGATVRAEVGKNEGTVRVEFTPRAIDRAPRKRPIKSTQPKSGDVLAPTPFK
jgi:serine/threonine-protein kinase